MAIEAGAWRRRYEDLTRSMAARSAPRHTNTVAAVWTPPPPAVASGSGSKHSFGHTVGGADRVETAPTASPCVQPPPADAATVPPHQKSTAHAMTPSPPPHAPAMPSARAPLDDDTASRRATDEARIAGMVKVWRRSATVLRVAQRQLRALHACVARGETLPRRHAEGLRALLINVRETRVVQESLGVELGRSAAAFRAAWGVEARGGSVSALLRQPHDEELAAQRGATAAREDAAALPLPAPVLLQPVPSAARAALVRQHARVDALLSRQLLVNSAEARSSKGGDIVRVE